MRQNLALLLAVALLLACLSLTGCDATARPVVSAKEPGVLLTAVDYTQAGTLHEIRRRGKTYLVLQTRPDAQHGTTTLKLDEWPDDAEPGVAR